jgi:hypothetical protein
MKKGRAAYLRTGPTVDPASETANARLLLIARLIGISAADAALQEAEPERQPDHRQRGMGSPAMALLVMVLGAVLLIVAAAACWVR